MRGMSLAMIALARAAWASDPGGPGVDLGPSCPELAVAWQAIVSTLDYSCSEDSDCVAAAAVPDCDCHATISGACAAAVRADAYAASAAPGIHAQFVDWCSSPAICDCGEHVAVCSGGACALENTECCLSCKDLPIDGPPDEPSLRDAAVDAPIDARAPGATGRSGPGCDCDVGNTGSDPLVGLLVLLAWLIRFRRAATP